MYTEVILRPQKMSGQRIYPVEARQMVAKALDGVSVSPFFFGRGDDGKTLGTRVNRQSPLAPIVFDGGNGFLRIYGVGVAGKAVLKAELGNILGALSSYTDGPVAMELREGKVDFKPGFKTYRIGKLAIGKHGKVRGEQFFALNDQFRAAGNDAEKQVVFRRAEDMIRSVLDRDIAGMAEQCNIFNVPRNLDIAIHDGELAISKIHNDRPGHVGVVKNLRFSMIGDLVGPWSVGHLRSHGYGLIKLEVNK